MWVSKSVWGEHVDDVTSFLCLDLTGGVTRKGERWEARLGELIQTPGFGYCPLMAENWRVYV